MSELEPKDVSHEHDLRKVQRASLLAAPRKLARSRTYIARRFGRGARVARSSAFEPSTRITLGTRHDVRLLARRVRFLARHAILVRAQSEGLLLFICEPTVPDAAST